MLRLIADLNLNSERGRQGVQERQRGRDRASWGEKRWAHSGKEICL